MGAAVTLHRSHPVPGPKHGTSAVRPPPPPGCLQIKLIGTQQIVLLLVSMGKQAIINLSYNIFTPFSYPPSLQTVVFVA